MTKRDYKIFGEGEYFHVYNRGNNLQDIFLEDEDYKLFLLRLKQNIFPDENTKRRQPLPAGSFSLLAYCLMPNHFHLLLRQNQKHTIPQLLLRLSTSYSKYFNKKYKRVGHVFQDRFKQVYIEGNDHLRWMYAYINLNPAVGKIVQNAEDYQWSSYRDIKSNSVGLCDTECIKEQFEKTEEFGDFMKDALPVLKINKDLRHAGIE